ncbi:hypothetical protein [Falsiroseomonas sp. E2-1-a20]|uniref:hypothetical protein n=1 Tax=Falsiroseomonas sp. E2-1-a20 TaxID=3239300 RepID=UPI003F36A9E6
MDFGTRSIRSAGIGSGSIEVTLPSRLRDLTGLPCRITLRDGLRPEIVLVPDLRPARQALQTLWTRLALALELPQGPLPLAETGIALRPDAALTRLAWTDALLLAAPPPHAPEAIARLLRALGVPAATQAGIAAEFVDACAATFAFAATALVPCPEDQEACDIAAAALAGAGLAPVQGAEDAGCDSFWVAAMPPLRRLRDLHLDLTATPSRHAALRRAWRQGVALELTGD